MNVLNLENIKSFKNSLSNYYLEYKNYIENQFLLVQKNELEKSIFALNYFNFLIISLAKKVCEKNEEILFNKVKRYKETQWLQLDYDIFTICFAQNSISYDSHSKLSKLKKIRNCCTNSHPFNFFYDNDEYEEFIETINYILNEIENNDSVKINQYDYDEKCLIIWMIEGKNTINQKKLSDIISILSDNKKQIFLDFFINNYIICSYDNENEISLSVVRELSESSSQQIFDHIISLEINDEYKIESIDYLSKINERFFKYNEQHIDKWFNDYLVNTKEKWPRSYDYNVIKKILTSSYFSKIVEFWISNNSGKIIEFYDFLLMHNKSGFTYYIGWYEEILFQKDITRQLVKQYYNKDKLKWENRKIMCYDDSLFKKLEKLIYGN